MNVLTVCTTGLYMDPARPDLSEQVRLTSMRLKALQSLSLVLFLPLSVGLYHTHCETLSSNLSHCDGSKGKFSSTKSLPFVACGVLSRESIVRNKSMAAKKLGSTPQSVHVGSSQGKRTCKASHSLHAGSSQENRSCVTTVWRRKSSDQGNCRLQAPSTPQSVHAGSSQGKRTCKASHSLHAGSSQENQSCVTTVWRRKSSDQGNCRLQAPSTPQSVHVGSSQGERTCKLGLYLPSSDQEMHVLYLGIQYVVEGRWKEFWSGWTKTSLSNERKIWISIYPCESRNGAHAYSLAQDECKTDDTVRFHSLHGVNIVIERAQADVLLWINNKYAYWRQNGKRKSSWWDHIRDEFIQIFRNVMVCLRRIYSKRIYSDGILVINNNNRETKLILFVKAATEEEFNNASRRDIIDLRQLMVEAVLKDYIECNAWDGTKEQAAIYFSKERLPNDLCDFIGRLYDENFVPINLDWLLNDPAFWSPDLKLGFFRVLYEIVRDQQLMDTGCASIFVSARLEEMKIANWERRIRREEPGRRVLNTMRRDQKRYNKNKFTKRDMFFDILLFCRHFIEHYNDKLPHHERKQKEEISLIVDKRFKGGCSMLWNSILEAWMVQPSSSKAERPEYMKRLMTVCNLSSASLE